MGFLKDRYCANCGSTMVTWRYREPHCFSCGCNLPFEDPNSRNPEDLLPDRTFTHENAMTFDLEDCIRSESTSFSIIFEPIFTAIHILRKKPK